MSGYNSEEYRFDLIHDAVHAEEEDLAEARLNCQHEGSCRIGWNLWGEEVCIAHVDPYQRSADA